MMRFSSLDFQSEIGLLFLLFVALMPHNLGLEFLRESCCCSQTRHLGGENISMPTNAVRLALLNADDFSKFLERKKPKSFATLALHNFFTYAVIQLS